MWVVPAATAQAGTAPFVAATFGAENQFNVPEDIVINEIMYNPPLGEPEWFELKNISASTVALGADLWVADRRDPAPLRLTFEHAGVHGAAWGPDGWLYFGNVYDGTLPPDDPNFFKFGFGPFPAPTTSGQISGIASGEGGPEQGTNQLVVFSNYDCCDPPNQGHFNGTDLVEPLRDLLEAHMDIAQLEEEMRRLSGLVDGVLTVAQADQGDALARRDAGIAGGA